MADTSWLVRGEGKVMTYVVFNYSSCVDIAMYAGWLVPLIHFSSVFSTLLLFVHCIVGCRMKTIYLLAQESAEGFAPETPERSEELSRISFSSS